MPAQRNGLPTLRRAHIAQRYPPSPAALLDLVEQARVVSLTFLGDAMGRPVAEAILAEPAECKLLQIERGEPCLLIRRRTWSGRVAVTAARLLHPGSRHRLEGRFSS